MAVFFVRLSRQVSTALTAARGLSFTALSRKLAKRVGRELATLPARLRDRLAPTYTTVPPFRDPRLAHYFAPPSMETLRRFAPEIRYLTAHFRAHRFSLLGSGWASLSLGSPCAGIEGYRYAASPSPEPDGAGLWLRGRINAANLRLAQAAWRTIDPGYQPIDWQRDFKSGFRWSEQTWHADIRYGHLPGVDIKVPWELARMQHLLMLVWGYGLAMSGEEGFAAPSAYWTEIRNQILDFVATNPPRFGVNWQCPMDVAIRAANWLVAYDLLEAFGAPVDPVFEERLISSLLDHGRFLYAHLEWDPEFTGNHYLANIAGLCFLAAYLPSSAETDAWLAFAIQELVRETAHQFAADGSNFEASTCYHGLSTELACYASMVVMTLPPERLEGLQSYLPLQPQKGPRLAAPPLPLYESAPLPRTHFERLARMTEFLRDATRPDGRLIQFGDNDSGHFLRPHPHLEAPAPGDAPPGLDGMRDSRPVLQAMRSLLGQDAPAEGWIGLNLRRSPSCPGITPDSELPFTLYPAFGLAVYRTEHLYLAIRCGDVGQEGRGGHAHNDVLSFELACNGVPIVVDPGTYLYTALPERRNAFRSTQAHNTLSLEQGEQSPFDPGRRGLFVLKEAAHPRIVSATADQFVGEHTGFGRPHRRSIRLLADRIEGLDEYDGAGLKRLTFLLSPRLERWQLQSDGSLAVDFPEGRMRFTCDAGSAVIETAPYSPAYGIIDDTYAIRVIGASSSIRWTIRWLDPLRHLSEPAC